MATRQTQTSTTGQSENGNPAGIATASDEIYLPIEAAIDKEAERTVCSQQECDPKRRKPIVSVNGEDVDVSSLPEGNKERAA